MKKILFLASLLLVSDSLFGNPVVRPQALISEFMFASDNKWELEICFVGMMDIYLHTEYDSICIVTSAGMARIRLDFVKDSISLLVITPDSLETPLSVNSSGDSIKLYSYTPLNFDYPLVDFVKFGDYPGSVCDSIPAGYSISRPNGPFGFFCLDRSPTIGASNDTCGCCATLTGFLFDKNHKKITSGSFSLNYPIAFNADSTYSTRIYARKYALSYVVELRSDVEYLINSDTANIDAYPDSTIKKDIYLVAPLGIKGRPAPSDPDLYVVNYPNPFNPGTNFYVRIPENLKRKVGRIDIYNSIGQKMFSVPLSNVSSYKWSGVNMAGKAVASGVYYYRLVFDNAVYKTGSMILLK